jgi:hypothetical protein
VAGHAPEFLPEAGRVHRWIAGVSDLRISLYMLLISGVVAAGLYVLARRLGV